MATQSCYRTDTAQTNAGQRLARQNAKSAGSTDYKRSPGHAQVLHECTQTKSRDTSKTTPNKPKLPAVMWSLILDFAGTKHRLIIRHDDKDDPEALLQTQLLTRALQEAGLIRRWRVTVQCQLRRCIHWFQLESRRWSLSCTNSLLATQKAIGNQLREMTLPNESNAFPNWHDKQIKPIRSEYLEMEAEFQIVLTGADFHRLTWRWIVQRAIPSLKSPVIRQRQATAMASPKAKRLKNDGDHERKKHITPSSSGRITLENQGLGKRLPPKLLRLDTRATEFPLRPAELPAYLPEEFIADRLREVNGHARDRDLSFCAKEHVYFWKGHRIKTSVTQMVHSFTEPFCENRVIQAMMQGSRWPRPGYLKPLSTNELSKILQHAPGTEPIRTELASENLQDEADVCGLLQALRQASTDRNQKQRQVLEDTLRTVCMSESEICSKWETARNTGAREGTWMHAQFECLLNGGSVPSQTPEIALFLRFLRRHPDMVAYRTEWRVCADREDIAGSIDFVAELQDGSKVLVDWKRTRSMSKKSEAFGKFLRPPLNSVPDCALWHYRLQLNVYRYIVQEYYGQVVSFMYIVGTHPDNGDEPWVENVPVLHHETQAMLLACAAKKKKHARKKDSRSNRGMPWQNRCSTIVPLLPPYLEKADLIPLLQMDSRTRDGSAKIVPRIRRIIHELRFALRPLVDGRLRLPGLANPYKLRVRASRPHENFWKDMDSHPQASTMGTQEAARNWLEQAGLGSLNPAEAVLVINAWPKATRAAGMLVSDFLTASRARFYYMPSAEINDGARLIIIFRIEGFEGSIETSNPPRSNYVIGSACNCEITDSRVAAKTEANFQRAPAGPHSTGRSAEAK
ncbi:ANKRD50 [Symbiodinium sp. CCMP2592]|nr:ANKRD50 [Symbiodinium sp. CCMP2592]